MLTRISNRNKVLIGYKLKQLPKSMICKLRDKLLEHKVTELQNFEDLDNIIRPPDEEPTIPEPRPPS